MAGIVTVDAIQVGDGLAANNLVIKTNDDGSFVIARGNVDGALTPILSIDADGKMVSAWETGVDQQSFATNGYQKLANGLIIQWGTVNTSSAGDTAVIFPVAFLTGRTVTCAHGSSAASASQLASLGNDLVSNLTGFSASTYLSNTAAKTNGTFRWIAIGY